MLNDNAKAFLKFMFRVDEDPTLFEDMVEKGVDVRAVIRLFLNTTTSHLIEVNDLGDFPEIRQNIEQNMEEAVLLVGGILGLG